MTRQAADPSLDPRILSGSKVGSRLGPPQTRPTAPCEGDRRNRRRLPRHPHARRGSAATRRRLGGSGDARWPTGPPAGCRGCVLLALPGSGQIKSLA